MPRIALLLTLAVVAWPLQAKSPPVEASGAVPGLALTGEATFRWLGFPLYDAALFTSGGAAFDWGRPFALELRYRRTIPGGLLVWATMAELTRMEGTRADHPAIEQGVAACFPDVAAGDRIVAVPRSEAVVSVWFNGRKRCDLESTDLRDRFFGIWLSENSRAPRLSRRLIGQP